MIIELYVWELALIIYMILSVFGFFIGIMTFMDYERLGCIKFFSLENYRDCLAIPLMVIVCINTLFFMFPTIIWGIWYFGFKFGWWISTGNIWKDICIGWFDFWNGTITIDTNSNAIERKIKRIIEAIME